MGTGMPIIVNPTTMTMSGTMEVGMEMDGRESMRVVRRDMPEMAWKKTTLGMGGMSRMNGTRETIRGGV